MNPKKTRNPLDCILGQLEERVAVKDTGNALDVPGAGPCVSANADVSVCGAGCPENVVDDIEAALTRALDCYIFAHDRQLFLRHLKAVAGAAAALPEDDLRPFLLRTSPAIDARIAYSGLWGNPGIGGLLGGARSFSWDEDDEEYPSPGLFATPFLAFLLAGTEFSFTSEELTGIRSGWGASVADIRSAHRRERGSVPERESRRAGNGNSGIVCGKGEGE